MGGESRAYREWREERGINPWVTIKPKEEKHDRIRKEVKGKKKRIEQVNRYGYLDKFDVASMLAYTVNYYSNTGLVLRNTDTGEYKRIPICSRWNAKSNDWYNKRYWDIYNSVKGDTKVTMLAIGYDQRAMYDLMKKSYWGGDFYGYLMARIGEDISAFLKRLRSHYKREGREWNYRGYAIEPHKESGIPHIHFYFKGGWIAGIDDIVRLWKHSKPQGIKVTVRTGKQAAGYLSSYLKKAIDCIKDGKAHLFYAYAYFYGVHLYRVAYGKRDKEEVKEDAIPLEEKFVKGKWECVGTDIITDQIEWDGHFKPFGEDRRFHYEEYDKGRYKEDDKPYVEDYEGFTKEEDED
jgi:hypothetical protein